MKFGQKTLIFFFSFLLIINFSLSTIPYYDIFDIIDISSNYTHVDPQDKLYFYIAVLSTNDIHGHFYPEQFDINGYNYTQGGLDYVAKYLNILRNEFPERVLYLDAGDLFQGGTESSLSNGDILTDSLNLMECQATTFGEHEFDYDREVLEEKVNNADFPYLSTNIYDNVKKSKKAFGENHLTSKTYLFNVTNSYIYKNGKEEDFDPLTDQVKIGIIGLSKDMKQNQIKGEGYNDIDFLDYKNEIIEESKNLREKEGCSAVLLLAHEGLSCGTEKTMELNMYTMKTSQEQCEKENNFYKFINSLEKNIIDGVISGHSHKQVHHWINEIPIMSSVDKGFYASIMYIPFKWNSSKQKYEIFKSKIQIEGPIPICEQIFAKTLKCDYTKPSEIEERLPLTEYQFHGVTIEKDTVLEPIHEKYDATYGPYKEQICEIVGTEDPITISDNGDFYIGNMISEIQSRITGADISLIGYDFLKAYWYPGKLPKYKINDLLPLENKLCTFVMKGYEIQKMMNYLQTSEKKYFPTYGIKQVMSKNGKGEYYLSEIKLFNGYKEEEIYMEKEYLISAIDYLIIKGNSGFDKILKWYDPKNLNCNHGDIKDLIEMYLKAQEVVDVTKYKDLKNPKIKFID